MDGVKHSLQGNRGQGAGGVRRAAGTAVGTTHRDGMPELPHMSRESAVRLRFPASLACR